MKALLIKNNEEYSQNNWNQLMMQQGVYITGKNNDNLENDWISKAGLKTRINTKPVDICGNDSKGKTMLYKSERM